MVVVTALLAAPQWVADAATMLAESASPVRMGMLVAALLVDMLLISAIIRIVRPARRDGLSVRMRGAKTEVSLGSVQREINTRVAQVADVLAVHTEVIEENGKARVALRVRTRPDIIVPEKQKELMRVLRQLVEKQLGLRLAGQPTVHIALSPEEFESTEQTATLITDSYISREPSVRYSLPTGSYEDYEDEEDEATPTPTAYEPVMPVQPQVETYESPAGMGNRAEKDEPWREFLLGE
jgi:hypothetical protein